MASLLSMTLSRRSRRQFPLFIVLAVAITGAGCARIPATLDDIIDRNTEAMGGRQAIEAVHSLAIVLHIVEPKFAVDGTYRAARPGRMRIDITADGKHVYTEAFDGQRGWQWKGEGTEVVEESTKATAALRHGVQLPGNLFGLHELREQGHQIELAGRETVDGTNYCLLKVTLSDGYSTTLYVDPNSWLVTRRRDVSPLHVDIDPTPTTMEHRMSDFRKVGGVVRPFVNSEVDLKTGKVLETATIRSMTVNPEFNDSIFTEL